MSAELSTLRPGSGGLDLHVPHSVARADGCFQPRRNKYDTSEAAQHATTLRRARPSRFPLVAVAQPLVTETAI